MSTQVRAGTVEDPAGPGDRAGEELTAARVLTCPGGSQAPRWRPGERLHHLFEERCDRNRDQGMAGHLAVDDGTVQLTYEQLDARANQLARHLIVLGAGPGDRIALLLDRAVPSYVSMLAIHKIHAAYVPLDAGFPNDRLSYIVQDAAVGMVLSLTHLRSRLAEIPATPVLLDEWEEAVPNGAGHRVTRAETGDPVDDLAYVIYTSGSTGRPKGVAVDHASICNFVRVAAEVYGIRSDDRVYQGMTIAFDFSMEEIWVPWVAGATLVPKSTGAILLGHELRAFLRDHAVTALCCVPTLLATIDEDLPLLRFLLVSGEACPRDLIGRWHRPERRFLNVYGPTEATVTATWSVVHPDRPVTLGVPLPTYSAVILDPHDARALPSGALGEIGIAGIGLARGYVNREDLTRKAFIDDFLQIDANPSRRIYRTGDLGRITEDGEVEYHGRIDTQVKVRGYRIELAEIESVLLQVPGIAQAVVDTYEPVPGTVELVGYYSLRQGVEALVEQVDQVYEHLRTRLPSYMVPAYLEHLDVIPMLPSNKADRKSLPAPRNGRTVAGSQAFVEPTTATELALAGALAGVLRLDRVSVDSHFFDDLGANSLLMAHFGARVRERGDLPQVAMKDVYLNPTIRRLATVLDAAKAPSARPTPAQAVRRASAAQHVACGAMQLLLFLAASYLSAVVAVAGFEWISEGSGWASYYLRSLAFGAATFVGLSVAPIAAKWLLVGCWRPQEIPAWSLAYVRFWTVKLLIRGNPLALSVGTPVYPLYLRALGAKIGRGVTILSPVVPVCTDLLRIGDGTVIRKESSFSCYRAHAGMIQTGTVTLGAHVLVGEATVLDIDTAMGDRAQLGHSSSLHRGQTVPPGQRWHGSPAQPTDVDHLVVSPARCGRLRRFSFGALHLVTRVVVVVSVAWALVSALLPRYLGTGHLSHSDGLFYLDLLAVSFVLFFGGVLVALAVVVTVPRVLNRALAPDRVYPLYGFCYGLHRTILRMTNLRFFMLATGDSSLIVHYLRLLGYDMGRIEQTGSNFGVALQHENPYLSSVGTGTMVSDGLSIGNAEYSGTSFRMSRTSIGSRSFLGNNIFYPSGGRTGDNCLLATKVMIPMDGDVRHDVGLLGSPCFEIPRSVLRDNAFDAMKSGAEFHRRLARKNRHNATTLLLFLATRWVFLFVILLLTSLVAALHDARFITVAVAAFPVSVVVVTVAYFALIERASLSFRPLHPLFCSIYEPAFWRHERFWKVSANVLAVLNGTPFKSVVWRLLGVRLGKRVLDDGSAIPEKSLVTIGDDCTLNALSTIQCHSMEDGAFKVDAIRIDAGCTIGVNAFVHYGVTMGEGAVLEADSFLMKGEEVEPHTTWAGNPARSTASSTAGRVARDTPAVEHRSLLREVSEAATPPVTTPSGVQLALFSLAACRRNEHALAGLLSDDEEREVLGFDSRDRRSTFVASRALVRLLLSTRGGIHMAPRDWQLTRTDRGKLTVRGPVDTSVDLSIAHTDEVLAIALSDQHDVGVDVEPSSLAGLDPAVWSVLSPAERQRLEDAPAPDRSRLFLQMWTLKEAYAKATGVGMLLDFSRLHTTPEPCTVVTPAPDDCAPARWRFHQQEVHIGDGLHWVAIAAVERSTTIAS